jgi:hypothetical protein
MTRQATPPRKSKGTAIVKARPSVPAVQKRTKSLVKADKNVTHSLVNLRETEGWLKLAKTGGPAAGFGMMTSAVALAIGLFLHAAAGTMVDAGAIGMLLGIGAHTSRIFRKIGVPDIDALGERLKGINVLYARGLLSDDLYAKAYLKATKDSKIV